MTTVSDELTVRKNSNTAVVGVAGVTVKNYDGENDITFGVNSDGNLCLGDTTFSGTKFVDRTQLDGTNPTGTTKAYVERKTAGGSEVAQVLVEETANANASIPLRGADGSLEALMPSVPGNANVINKAYLEGEIGTSIAPLDSSAKLPTANLPSEIPSANLPDIPQSKLPEGTMTYKGNDWDASDGFPEDADPSYTPVTGDYWECGTGGTIDGVVYRVGDIIVYTGSEWKKQGGSNGAPLSDNTPEGFGTASAGVSGEASRSDHVHPIPTFGNVIVCSTEMGYAGREITIPNGPTTYSEIPDGMVIGVYFVNGYYGNSSQPSIKLGNSTIPIFVMKDGSHIGLPSHNCIRSESNDNTVHDWFFQAGTFLTLRYQDGAGFVIIGNPVVLSYTSSTQSYLIYSTGLIKQSGLTTLSTSTEAQNLLIAYKDTNYVITAIPSNSSNNDPSTGDTFCIRSKAAGSFSCRWNNQGGRNWIFNWVTIGY